MAEMNALVLNGIGDLEYKKVNRPVPQKGEVLLRVKSCGICSSDIPRIFKTGTYHFPTIPGHEFSGVIEEVGENADSSLKGKRAAVFPLLPCFKCEPCSRHQYAQCKNYNYFGSRCDGAFAEYVSVPTWNIVPFGNELDYELGALCEPLAVSLHAFKSSDIKPHQSIAIVGTGTIGFMIGLIAKNSGVENIFICGRNKAKIEFAKKLGFKIANTSESLAEHIAGLTDKKGVDIVFECVGSPDSINSSVEICGTMGTVVLVGNPTGDISFGKNIYWKILRQQITVKGVWNSSYSDEINDWRGAIALLEKHGDKFRELISDTFPLERAAEAFNKIRDCEKFTLKVMFNI